MRLKNGSKEPGMAWPGLTNERAQFFQNSYTVHLLIFFDSPKPRLFNKKVGNFLTKAAVKEAVDSWHFVSFRAFNRMSTSVSMSLGML
jgi:hypothetical protein